MNALDMLFALSGITILVALLGIGLRATGWLLSALYLGQLWLLFGMAGLGFELDAVESARSFEIFGHALSWRFDAVSWFFALITLGSALPSAIYASGEWGAKFRESGGSPGLLQLALAANVFAMLLLLGSGDFVSLFIGWELVSWAGFLMMLLAKPEQRDAAVKYITYATAAAMALLGALALIHARVGSLDYAAFAAAAHNLSVADLAILSLLLFSAFGIKLAVLPFHLWQARAYAETPGPGAAFLGAISGRMGLYAIAVVLFQLISIDNLAQIALDQIGLPIRWDIMDVMVWVAVLTIILPTFTAMKQTDARLLLAWHGIGQGGYMLLGLAIGTSLGSAGGLLHVFNYATYQAALLLAVFAVIHRTGTADLNRMGGLAARMPLSFLVLLIGIIGLAGLPPLNGFVSKWMIYVALIQEGRPLVFIGAVIGTLGTILSVFKLIHNMFLGSLRVEHEQIAEAPWSMMLPMLALSAVVLITGIFPGIALEWVANAQSALGFQVIEYQIGGVAGLDMRWIGGVLLYGFLIGMGLFFLGSKSRRVHPLDNYAGGHFLSAQNQYHYSDHFYAGLTHLIGGWYRASFAKAEAALIRFTDFLASLSSGAFRIAQPMFVLVLAVLLILLWALSSETSAGLATAFAGGAQ